MKIVELEALGAPVRVYLHENHDRLVAHKTRPAVVICPGGAYRWLSPREQDPAALHFLAKGYQTVLLDYAVAPEAGDYRPLRQLAATVREVRAHAAQWHIDPAKIALLGFSAGGHLACSLGALWDDFALNLGADCRPDALMLCYPVITAGAYASNAESIENVTGGDPALRAALSLEKRVGPGMPPTFLWHCVGDESVPVENSLLLAEALQSAHIPFECHLFAGGAHGISMCTQEVETPWPDIAPWVGLCERWLNAQFDFTP